MQHGAAEISPSNLYAGSQDFIKSLPAAARKKILYNIVKIEGGVKDCELFKKLSGYSDFWELLTQYDGKQYRLRLFGMRSVIGLWFPLMVSSRKRGKYHQRKLPVQKRYERSITRQDEKYGNIEPLHDGRSA